MAATTITNAEFLELFKMKKTFANKDTTLPHSGSKVQFILNGEHQRTFFLDVNRSGIIELKKFTLQNRYMVIPLIRLDIDSAPHINPDGTKVSRNHIHIYKEGYGDSWAYELNEINDNCFDNCSEFSNFFLQFCKYCNIEIPQAQLSI